MLTVIDRFHGEFAFLSNFFFTPIVFQGMVYPTAEHAYQAAKTDDDSLRRKIRKAKRPGEAKRLGREVPLRDSWDELKDGIMLRILRAKFDGEIMQELLLDTEDAELIEGNNWGDTYWGVCNGEGQNKLGKMLMQVRDEIRSSEPDSG